jgi:TatA/E family protein of Tat protein translocase
MGLDNPLHLLILGLVVRLAFGAKRLPDLGRSLGDGMRGLRASLEGGESHAIALPATAVAALQAPGPAASAQRR